jgi:GT2 family glycosyltransferase
MSSLVTVVVVPRERFGIAHQTLAILLHNTNEHTPIIYVDGGGPDDVYDFLTGLTWKGGLQIIRCDYFLSPNEARNIGFSRVKSKYTVFIDNDVLVEPGWLETLVRCAEHENAAVVGPLYLEAGQTEPLVHMAGGYVSIDQIDGRICMVEKQRHSHIPLRDINIQACRGPTGEVEFHCMLVASEMLQAMDGFDEGFLNTREHVDFCLCVQQAGGVIFLEPATMVTCLLGRNVEHLSSRTSWSDTAYFLLRWSEAWSRSSLAHADAKRGLTEDHQYFVKVWLIPQRRKVLMPYRQRLRRVVGEYIADWAMDLLERHIAGWYARKRLRGKSVVQLNSERKSSNLPLGPRGISST